MDPGRQKSIIPYAYLFQLKEETFQRLYGVWNRHVIPIKWPKKELTHSSTQKSYRIQINTFRLTFKSLHTNSPTNLPKVKPRFQSNLSIYCHQVHLCNSCIQICAYLSPGPQPSFQAQLNINGPDEPQLMMTPLLLNLQLKSQFLLC